MVRAASNAKYDLGIVQYVLFDFVIRCWDVKVVGLLVELVDVHGSCFQKLRPPHRVLEEELSHQSFRVGPQGVNCRKPPH